MSRRQRYGCTCRRGLEREPGRLFSQLGVRTVPISMDIDRVASLLDAGVVVEVRSWEETLLAPC